MGNEQGLRNRLESPYAASRQPPIRYTHDFSVGQVTHLAPVLHRVSGQEGENVPAVDRAETEGTQGVGVLG